MGSGAVGAIGPNVLRLVEMGPKLEIVVVLVLLLHTMASYVLLKEM